MSLEKYAISKVDPKELIDVVFCEDCKYYETDECRWREDEQPFEEDFCSYGVMKEEEEDDE